MTIHIKKECVVTTRYVVTDNIWASEPREISRVELVEILEELAPNPKFVLDLIHQKGRVQLPAILVEIIKHH